MNEFTIYREVAVPRKPSLLNELGSDSTSSRSPAVKRANLVAFRGDRSDEWSCMNAATIEHTDLAMYRTGRSLEIDTLAREQAILNHENETDMSEQDVAALNAASFRNKGERNFFKNEFRRHTRNIAAGNPFYR